MIRPPAGAAGRTNTAGAAGKPDIIGTAGIVNRIGIAGFLAIAGAAALPIRVATALIAATIIAIAAPAQSQQRPAPTTPAQTTPAATQQPPPRSLAPTITQRVTPPRPAPDTARVCDGRFERLLRGFFFEPGELHPFIADAAAIADCRRQLDPAKPDHALIDAMLLRHGPAPDEATAQQRFDTACAASQKLACAWRRWPVGAAPTQQQLKDATAPLYALLELPYPAVNTMLGVASLLQPDPTPQMLADASRLLQHASHRGDWWATAALLQHERRKPPAQQDTLLPEILTDRAIAQGSAQAMERRADALQQQGDIAAATLLLRRAADADPRWFQHDVAHAAWRLSHLLRHATPPDPQAADHYLQRAAALGSELAQQELRQHGAPSAPSPSSSPSAPSPSTPSRTATPPATIPLPPPAIAAATVIVPGSARLAATVCEGRFEPLLRGRFFYAVELLPFIDDAAAIAACRNQLDASNDDHVLIDAWLLRHSAATNTATSTATGAAGQTTGSDAAANEAAAEQRFAAICARNHRLGCAWGLWPAGRPPDPDAAAAVADALLGLVDPQFPAIDTMAALALLSQPQPDDNEIDQAVSLLRRASAAGDLWATTALLEELRERPPPSLDARALQAQQVELEERAAVQGNVVQMLIVAAALAEQMNDAEGALRLYRRAADADPRWFQPQVARANHALATRLRTGDGAPPDQAEATRRLHRAAALGDAQAQQELNQR